MENRLTRGFLIRRIKKTLGYCVFSLGNCGVVLPRQKQKTRDYDVFRMENHGFVFPRGINFSQA